MVPNMRLKQITNLSTALLVTACLALGGTLWWSEGALERPYLLMERYLGGEDIDQALLTADLEKAVARGSFFPVIPVCSSTGACTRDPSRCS